MFSCPSSAVVCLFLSCLSCDCTDPQIAGGGTSEKKTILAMFIKKEVYMFSYLYISYVLQMSFNTFFNNFLKIRNMSADQTVWHRSSVSGYD